MSKALDRINAKMGWQLAAQAGTLLAVHNVSQSVDHLAHSMGDSLNRLQETQEFGFARVESALQSLEFKLLAGLSDIEWQLASMDASLTKLVGLVEYPSATASAEKYIQASELYRVGQAQKALGILSKALEENPLNVNAIVGQVLCHVQLTQEAEAEVALKQLMAISKTDYTYQVEESEAQKMATDRFLVRFILGRCIQSGAYDLGREFGQNLEAEVEDDAISIQRSALSILSGHIDSEVESIMEKGLLGPLLRLNLIQDKKVLGQLLEAVERVFVTQLTALAADDMLGESELEGQLGLALQALSHVDFKAELFLHHRLDEMTTFREVLIVETKKIQSGYGELSEAHQKLKASVQTYEGLKVTAVKESVHPYLKEDYDQFIADFTAVLEKDLREKEVMAKKKLSQYEKKHGKTKGAKLVSVELKQLALPDSWKDGKTLLVNLTKTMDAEKLYPEVSQAILRGCLASLASAPDDQHRALAMSTGLRLYSRVETLEFHAEQVRQLMSGEGENEAEVYQKMVEAIGSLVSYISRKNAD